MQVIKLDEQEVKFGSETHDQYQSMLQSLGNLESRILKIHNTLDELIAQKKSLHTELVVVEQQFQDFVEGVGVKYGSGQLNFMDGTLTIQ
jgi:hypothetical protein